MTLFKTVSKLKDLAEKDGRDNYKLKFTGETQHVNSRLNNGRKKLEVDPNFFLDKNPSQKKKKKKKKKKNTSVKPWNTTRTFRGIVFDHSHKKEHTLEMWAVIFRFLLIYKNMLKSIAMARSECRAKYENKASYNTDSSLFD